MGGIIDIDLLKSFPLPFRAQLLSDSYKRLYSILEIHFNGYLIMFFEGEDETYIRLKNTFDSILNTNGFESLRNNYSDFLPNSLHSFGDEIDELWVVFRRELLIFQGQILEFCNENNSGYFIEEVKNKTIQTFKPYDDFIYKIRNKKNNEEKKFLQDFEKPREKFVNNDKDKFINDERILQIESIKSEDFDFSKLIKICKEINITYSNECYFAVSMLVRALLDHIPPIFGFGSFKLICINYNEGGKSFQESMVHLDKSQRKIADSFLHTQIRKNETLPNLTQINFSNDIDFLLSEIYRINKN